MTDKDKILSPNELEILLGLPILRRIAKEDAERSSGEPSYTCPLCGRTSYNPNDLANQYCGACHQFAEPFWMQDVRIAQRLRAPKP